MWQCQQWAAASEREGERERWSRKSTNNYNKWTTKRHVHLSSSHTRIVFVSGTPDVSCLPCIGWCVNDCLVYAIVSNLKCICIHLYMKAKAVSGSIKSPNKVIKLIVETSTNRARLFFSAMRCNYTYNTHISLCMYVSTHTSRVSRVDRAIRAQSSRVSGLMAHTSAHRSNATVTRISTVAAVCAKNEQYKIASCTWSARASGKTPNEIKIFKQSFIGKMIVYAIFWSNPTAHFFLISFVV